MQNQQAHSDLQQRAAPQGPKFFFSSAASFVYVKKMCCARFQRKSGLRTWSLAICLCFWMPLGFVRTAQ